MLANSSLLEVSDLAIRFPVEGKVASAVDGVSFTIPRGKTLGLVGESGCGKSMTSLGIMRLVPPPGEIRGTAIHLEATNLLNLTEPAMRKIRGREIAMIFQEPMTSLNPVFTIGDQIMEALLAHETIALSEARARAEAVLADVGIPHPPLAMARYPHELSGGMKQRAMIAMALICCPKLLIADEPTTALDVTVQAQILDILRRLQHEHGMSMLFITHSLGVVAEIAHEVAVMYAGRIVEKARTEDLFEEPLHPYTQGLFQSLPRLEGSRKRLSTIPGQVPPPTEFPTGCRFHNRCAKALPLCKEAYPPYEEKRPGRFCACHVVKKERR